jgi:hypothetical protein
LVKFYQTTRRYNPEDIHPQNTTHDLIGASNGINWYASPLQYKKNKKRLQILRAVPSNGVIHMKPNLRVQE